ncbi:eukaryotic translation initiation factor 3 subunit J [Chrysoperla carnea]|uniref:eukaryotic translation initiation factor 3 subunit J n=1 Tax=Chrysoperla carnea TaxID=189513 RepID=UPI001D086158|nr:eukaryotic translation initiation factor 3 subunit J [Chrysoperla carnea]
MDEDWDSENFEAKSVLPNVPVVANKWEGEDEEDEVKESWEDEEEEKRDVEKVEVKSKPKPKKALADKIAEKERQRLEELERKQKERESEMTLEEKLAEKLRRQKLQEESDLQLAKETFGINVVNESTKSLDSMNPQTQEDFIEYADAISKRVQTFNKSPEYVTFVEDLIRNICVSLSSTDLKKLKTTIDTIFQEKQKVEKGEKSKKNKGKGKAKLKIEGDNSHLNEYSVYQDYDYDDFM